MPFHPSQWSFHIDTYLNSWVPSPPWQHIPYPIAHFFGYRIHPPRRLGNLAMVFWAFIGVFCGLTIIEATTHAVGVFREHGAPIIIGSYGAAAVLEFYAIESPLAQPRNAVLGQIFSSIIGIGISKLFSLGPGPPSLQLRWVGGSLSCATATAFMALTGTVHPPGAATALLAVVDDHTVELGWWLTPLMMIGCVLMQAVALLLNNIQRQFPAHWWSAEQVGQRWKGEEKWPQGKEPCSSDDSDGENGGMESISRVVSPRGIEEGRAGRDAQLVIMRGRVIVPEGMYMTPEDRSFLEELCKRI